ncbi:MAG: hypothetical protein R3258_09355 [Acidimicrobiia bacterium]|nr:hypothetical protein [Acidimicrobiia bacterium]
MAETTTTTLTELILAKAVDRLIIAYQYDDVMFVPFFRFKSMVGESATQASFPRWVKDAHSDALASDETASLTAETLETTTVDISLSRVGIYREIAENSFEDTILGRAALMSEIVMDTAQLLGEALDEDGAAEFANAASNVTDSGNPTEVLDIVEAMGTQRANKAKGPQVICLSDEQLKDLQRGQVAATATPWASFYQPSADSTQFGGYFMNAPIFASSKTTTANTGANDVGCVFARGDVSPRFCAFAYALKRLPTTKMDETIEKDTHKVVTISRYGVGTPATNFATKIVTDAAG